MSYSPLYNVVEDFVLLLQDVKALLIFGNAGDISIVSEIVCMISYTSIIPPIKSYRTTHFKVRWNL